MISHVAFLRAINTGGRRVTNDDLITAARRSGFADVAAYQASGNLLIADALDLECSEIAERLTLGLSDALGFEVPTIVRTVAELVGIAGATPFGENVPVPGSKPQVVFLAARPAEPFDLDAFATPDDRLALVGSDLHWWPREGSRAPNSTLPGSNAASGR